MQSNYEHSMNYVAVQCCIEFASWLQGFSFFFGGGGRVTSVA